MNNQTQERRPSARSEVAERDSQDTVLQTASTELALRPEQGTWSPNQMAALSILGVKNATRADLDIYLHFCQRTGLDPFAKQVYMIARRERVKPGSTADCWVTKQTIQVGIDGFRLARERGASRAGVTVDFEDTIWFDAKGLEHKVWLSAAPPTACRVVLVKHTANGPMRFPAVLRTASYMPLKEGKPTGQWGPQPDHMIEKCCEAFASRRAFPQDLSGVYIEEEMQGPNTQVIQATVEPGGREQRRQSARSQVDKPKPIAQLRKEAAAFFEAAGFGSPNDEAQRAVAAMLLRESPDARPVPVDSLANLNHSHLAVLVEKLARLRDEAVAGGRDVAGDMLRLARAATGQDGGGQDG